MNRIPQQLLQSAGSSRPSYPREASTGQASPGSARRTACAHVCLPCRSSTQASGGWDLATDDAYRFAFIGGRGGFTIADIVERCQHTLNPAPPPVCCMCVYGKICSEKLIYLTWGPSSVEIFKDLFGECGQVTLRWTRQLPLISRPCSIGLIPPRPGIWALILGPAQLIQGLNRPATNQRDWDLVLGARLHAAVYA
jgi:hypothetical protein